MLAAYLVRWSTLLWGAGAYLLVGLYRLEDGTRLPAVDGSGARVLNDAVRIEFD